MALTPEQIQAMNETTGLNKPTQPTSNVGQSRADEIRNLAKSSTKVETSPKLTSGLGVGRGSGVGALDLTAPIIDTGKNIVESTKNQFNEAKNTYSDYLDRVNSEKPLEAVGDAFRTGANLAKNVTGIVASPVTEIAGKVLKPLEKITQPLTDALGNTPEVQAFTEFMSKYPKLSGTLADLIGTGMNVTALETAKNTPEAIKSGIKTGEEFANKTLDRGSKLLEETKTRISGKPETSSEVVGKITQATGTDLPVAERALSSIDTSGVKTFKDLSSKLDEQIKNNTKTVDTSFAKDNTPRKIQTLAKEVKVGDSIVRHNYVIDAIEQLKNYYEKTNNIEGLSKIKNLETKIDPIKGEGLTPNEVNLLAREHGKVLNAYNANGELASGLTKQAAENTRTGLKETARDLMPDENTRAVDKNTADLIKTKEMIDDMSIKVDKLQNQLEKAGLLQKAGAMLGKGINLATGGLAKGLFKSILDVGIKEGTRLNPVELQQALQNNLSKLESLLKK